MSGRITGGLQVSEQSNFNALLPKTLERVGEERRSEHRYNGHEAHQSEKSVLRKRPKKTPKRKPIGSVRGHPYRCFPALDRISCEGDW